MDAPMMPPQPMAPPQMNPGNNQDMPAGIPGMDISHLFQKLAPNPMHTFGAQPFAGVNPGNMPKKPEPAPAPTKSDAFPTGILVEAQKTFAQQGPNSTTGKAIDPTQQGTNSAMIPPGWSSQSAMSKRK